MIDITVREQEFLSGLARLIKKHGGVMGDPRDKRYNMHALGALFTLEVKKDHVVVGVFNSHSAREKTLLDDTDEN